MKSFEDPGFENDLSFSKPAVGKALLKAPKSQLWGRWGGNAPQVIHQADQPPTWHLVRLLQVQDIPNVEFGKG